MELWRLLAHNHWITLNLRGFKVRLCARCSGYTIGFTAPLLLEGYLDVLWSLGTRVQVLVCVLLALPCVLDWLTQCWGLRESSNMLRLVTGILMGGGVLLFSQISSLQGKTNIFMGAALAVVLTGHIGKNFIRREN